MQLPGLMFGSGVALAAPQPSSGNPAPNPTPMGLGVLQNIKLTLGADIKSLYGIDQWAVDTAIGKRSIKGSFEFAQISNLLMSQLFFGDGTDSRQRNHNHLPRRGAHRPGHEHLHHHGHQ